MAVAKLLPQYLRNQRSVRRRRQLGVAKKLLARFRKHVSPELRYNLAYAIVAS